MGWHSSRVEQMRYHIGRKAKLKINWSQGLELYQRNRQRMRLTLRWIKQSSLSSRKGGKLP